VYEKTDFNRKGAGNALRFGMYTDSSGHKSPVINKIKVENIPNLLNYS
jgi:hypothetical protein